jgi:uncharacterized protein (TIGR02231 family)
MHALLLPLLLTGTSQVSRVVVYPDRAQVTRSAAVPCGPHALFRFEELPPATDPRSVRASVDRGNLVGLRVEAAPRTALYSQEAESVRGKLDATDRAIAALHDGQTRAQARGAVAQSLGEVTRVQLGRDLAQGKPDAATWNSAVQLQLDQRLEAVRESVQLASQLRLREREREELSLRLQQLAQAGQQLAFVAEAIVDCPRGQSATLELTYLVGGAGWEPAYEARADEASGKVELSTFATVHQATGEPWTAVEVTLSTAVPRASATPPQIQPLHVSGYDVGEEHKVLTRRDESVRHAESGATTVSEGAGMRAVDQGLSVQLRVEGPADVPGDGRSTRLFVARTPLHATFARRAVPKLSGGVFRVADVTNTAPFPLLPGPLDAFRGSDFAGRLQLPRVPVGAPAHLTFGVDGEVKTRRKVIEEIARETGLFGGNRRFRYHYRFEVQNLHRAPSRVELAEHLPVSEIDDVKVELDGKTTPGYALRAEDGIATWTLQLAPGESKIVDLAFHVDVPASYDTSGL